MPTNANEPPGVAEIAARVEAITPGEWTFFPDDFHRDDIRVCNSEDGKCIGCLLLVGNYNYEKDEWTEETIKQAEANAVFVAHAPADIRYLLSERDDWRTRALAAEGALENYVPVRVRIAPEWQGNYAYDWDETLLLVGTRLENGKRQYQVSGRYGDTWIDAVYLMLDVRLAANADTEPTGGE